MIFKNYLYSAGHLPVKKLAMIFGIVTLAFSLSGCWETSSGEKIGMVVKTTKSGLIFKTMEVETIRLSAKSIVPTGMAPFDCSVENIKVFDQLTALLDKEKQIRFRYHKELFIASWRGDTRCMLDEIVGEIP